MKEKIRTKEQEIKAIKRSINKFGDSTGNKIKALKKLKAEVSRQSK